MTNRRLNAIAEIARKLVRRTGWGLGDQAFSSLTNVALGLMIARSVSAQDFGAFSLAYATYTLCLGFSRAVNAEPLIVRFSNSSLEAWRSAAASATGTAILLGLIAGAGCVTFGLATSGPLADSIVALGMTLPGLLLQDTWRYAFFARGSGRSAFLNDLAWALIMFPSILVLVATQHTSIGWLTLGWGGSGAAAGLLGILQTKIRPRSSLTRRWLQGQSDLASRYLGEFAAMSGARQVSFYAVGAIAGLQAAGAIRGSQMLLGPIQVLQNGLRLVAIPEAVRVSKQPEGRLQRACNILALSLSSMAVLWGILILCIPDRLGQDLLGETWRAAHAVVLPLTFVMAGGGITMSSVVGLRALAAAQRSLGARLLVSLFQVSGTIIGAFLAGATGAAWGLAFGVWCGIPVWQWQFRKALGEHKRVIDESDRISSISPEVAPAG